MDKPDQVVGLIFFVLVVVALMSAAFNSINTTQNTENTTNETLTFTAQNTEYTANDDLIAVQRLVNATSTDITNYCNVTVSSGFLQCNETNSNTGYIDYTYYPDTYVKNTGARTLIGLSSLILVIGFVVFLWNKKK